MVLHMPSLTVMMSSKSKIYVAFPDIDVSSFMPTETKVPDNGGGGSGEAVLLEHQFELQRGSRRLPHLQRGSGH